MLRDAADETEDMKIVEQFDISAIDTESLKGFRNHHKSYRPEHVFNNLPDDEQTLYAIACLFQIFPEIVYEYQPMLLTIIQIARRNNFIAILDTLDRS